MTQGTPVERVVALLKTAGYREVPLPMIIGTVRFQFSAVLLGSGRAPDLVVVIDTIEESESRVRQKVAALSRALDVAGSRRPLTAVLAGPRPQSATLEMLGRVCRVLPVGTPVGDDADKALTDWLAVLMPLRLPDPTDAVADPLGELVRHLPNGTSTELADVLLAAVGGGNQAVSEALQRELSRMFVDQGESDSQ